MISGRGFQGDGMVTFQPENYRTYFIFSPPIMLKQMNMDRCVSNMSREIRKTECTESENHISTQCPRKVLQNGTVQQPIMEQFPKYYEKEDN